MKYVLQHWGLSFSVKLVNSLENGCRGSCRNNDFFYNKYANVQNCLLVITGIRYMYMYMGII